MTEDIRTILNRVAAGELSVEDAQALIDAPVAADATPPAAEIAESPVARVIIRSTGMRLTVVGDPAVDTAIADGPHRVTREGDQLLINSDLTGGDEGEYTNEAPRSAFMNWVSNMNKAGAHLRVRINPKLPLEILNIAGPLELSAVSAPTAVGVEAGSAKLTGGSGPLNLSVATGSANVEWLFTGESSVSAEIGSANVTLLPGSDVVVTAEASMGTAHIRTPQGVQKASGSQPQSATVGNGTGHLKVSAKLGSADVRVV
ncbi:MAG: hypothetical protein ACOYEV_12400 [Candidatus Nanopelagicales bacterium]